MDVALRPRTVARPAGPAAEEPSLWVVAGVGADIAPWCEALADEGIGCDAGASPPASARAIALHCSTRVTDHLACVRELSALNPRRPLVVVAQRPRAIDQVLALEMGADDVIEADVPAPVVAARLRALWRRSTTMAATEPERLDFGRLQLSLRERAVCLGDERIGLTECEFEVLWLLAVNAGQAVSRHELLQRLRGLPYQRIDRSIDCRVFRVRAKLRDGRGPAQRIRTVRNCGYLFSPARW